MQTASNETKIKQQLFQHKITTKTEKLYKKKKK